MHIETLPRFLLAQLPTPIERLERLSRELGGPELLIKRDDQTGLALGGNKTRKLEFLVGQALEQGADTLVTAGAAQSNHCRQTAAAAVKAGQGLHSNENPGGSAVRRGGRDFRKALDATAALPHSVGVPGFFLRCPRVRIAPSSMRHQRRRLLPPPRRIGFPAATIAS